MTINHSLTPQAAKASPTCPYCFTPVDGESVTCPACGAGHHADCYAEAGACAVHGCAASAERRDAAQPASTVSGPNLPPPPSGAAPVASYPPPSGAAPVASSGPQAGSRVAPLAPLAPPVSPRPEQNTWAAAPASLPAADESAGHRHVVVNGRASATIYQGKLLVATSEGVQYQFQL